MATNRNTRSDRKRSRSQTAGRASARSRARAASDASDAAARSAQAQLLQNAQQVWLAGMGAIARAQKDGPTAFSDAVLEGLRLLNQSRSTAQRMVRDAFESAQESLQSRVGDARGQAQDTWDQLETLFQTRVQRAMHQLGVPTAEDIRALTRRVAELNENVKRIEARGGQRKVAGGKRKVAGGKRRAGARTRRRATGAADSE